MRGENAVQVDYRYDPEAYEIEERARPDELSMIQRVGERTQALLEYLPRARVLDLCCGTGLSMEAIASSPQIELLVGVDNCPQYLGFAQNRYSDHSSMAFFEADAVEVGLPDGSWDIIILCSAYHHIENDRKNLLLKKVRRLLSERGTAVMGENILPPYEMDDGQSYADAVRLFYREVLSTSKTANPDLPPDVEALINRVAQYGFDGDYEYKTSLDILVAHLRASGLKIRIAEKVWPVAGPLCMTTGGNYVFELVRAPTDGANLDAESALL